MEFTARQVVDICTALKTMQIKCRMKYRDARKLSDLKKLFEERTHVIGHMESDLVKNCGGTIRQDGKVEFSEPSLAETFVSEHNKLFEDKDEIEFAPVDLSEYIDDIEITVEGVEALDGIILFSKED